MAFAALIASSNNLADSSISPDWTRDLTMKESDLSRLRRSDFAILMASSNNLADSSILPDWARAEAVEARASDL